STGKCLPGFNDFEKVKSYHDPQILQQLGNYRMTINSKRGAEISPIKFCSSFRQKKFIETSKIED
ncbi:MAG: hypothetical protein ACR2OW_02930, partial [Methyloligellaceae bacterium]